MTMRIPRAGREGRDGGEGCRCTGDGGAVLVEAVFIFPVIVFITLATAVLVEMTPEDADSHAALSGPVLLTPPGTTVDENVRTVETPPGESLVEPGALPSRPSMPSRP